MNEEKVARVSIMLPHIAEIISDTMEALTGEKVGFALHVFTNKVSQYVSNCDRGEITEMMEELLARFKANRADIPAHYNPDLKAQHKAEYVEVPRRITPEMKLAGGHMASEILNDNAPIGQIAYENAMQQIWDAMLKEVPK